MFFSHKKKWKPSDPGPEKREHQLGKIILRVSDYSQKRVSLTGLAEIDVSAVGRITGPDGMILSDTVFVKVNH
jgi:hypothetical protein